MDLILLVIAIIVMMTISLIAAHLWVGIWDGVIALLKNLFRIKRKPTVNWHTLEEDKQKKSKTDLEKTNTEISENESLY